MPSLNESGFVLGPDGAICSQYCGCPTEGGFACNKVVATFQDLAGCLEAFNGVDIVLCELDPADPAIADADRLPAGDGQYHGIASAGDVVARVTLSGSVVLVGGTPEQRYSIAIEIIFPTDGSAAAFVARCVGSFGSPTAPSSYSGELTVDVDAGTIGSTTLSGGVDGFPDGTVAVTAIAAEDCCDRPCGYQEVVTDLGVDGSGRPLGTQTAVPFVSCEDCCNGFQLVYPGGKGPVVTFGVDGAGPRNVQPASFLLGGTAHGGFGSFTDVDSNPMPGSDLDSGTIGPCAAAGFAFARYDPPRFDVPSSPPTVPPDAGGDFVFYGTKGVLRRAFATFLAGTDTPRGTSTTPPFERRPIWTYVEYYLYWHAGSYVHTDRAFRARWANADGPCPPGDVDAWNGWSADLALELGISPDDATEPTDVIVSGCPSCGCACAGRYRSDYDKYLGTWGAVTLLKSGCIPKWDAPLWPEACPENTPITGRYVRSETWTFFDACKCDLSDGPCTVPASIDPPTYTPKCLTCPDDLPGCCARLVFKVLYLGDTTRVVVIRSGSTFTSDDSRFTLECVGGIFRAKLTVADDPLSPYVWVAAQTPEACVPLDPDGATFEPQFADTNAAITSVICAECDTCCATIRVNGKVSGVTFDYVLTLGASCVYNGPNGSTVTLLGDFGRAVINVPGGHTATFGFDLRNTGTEYCPDVGNVANITTISADDPGDTTFLTSLVCEDPDAAHCWTSFMYFDDRGTPSIVELDDDCSSLADAKIEAGVSAANEWEGPRGDGSYLYLAYGSDVCAGRDECTTQPTPPPPV